MAQITLESPVELMHHQLRTAVTMENDSLASLGELTKAAKNEHDEIPAYQSPTIAATAMGASDVVALLNANLDQETHTSEELRSMLQKVSG